MKTKHVLEELNRTLNNLHEVQIDLRGMHIISAYERIDGSLNVLKALRDRIAKEDADNA